MSMSPGPAIRKDPADHPARIRSAMISPSGILELLSQQEMKRLREIGQGSVHELFRQCALAVLNCEGTTDNAEEVFAQYSDFTIEIQQRTRGIKLKLSNAPACAFVDGRILNGVRDHLFAVLRDIVFVASELELAAETDAGHLAEGRLKPRNLVFNVLRNAGLMHPGTRPNLVVCWGGHSISREEYDYSKQVGYQLGLRDMDICTGCGPGAMKGPMKGAAVAHAKQRNYQGRYVGITEPGIIAAESPNPIVNQLVVLPDIEKRLEAFVRLGHGIIVFPGGVGTLEEILFLLGILMAEGNAEVLIPLIFTEPASSKGYFRRIDDFLVQVLGEEVRRYYQVVEEDAHQVARLMKAELARVGANRRKSQDAYYYNWMLQIPREMKRPFQVSHENMASLLLSRKLAPAELAINLRRAFSGIVSGNVKEHGLKLIREQGPFQLRAEPDISVAMDRLLREFVTERRMKLAGKTYDPCYTVLSVGNS